MATLLDLAPVVALGLAIAALGRRGGHPALFGLLTYALVWDLVRLIGGEATWSEVGYILNNGGICLGITMVALEAGRSSVGPIWTLVRFRVLMLELSAGVAGQIIDELFPSSMVIRPMARVHAAAGASCGVVLSGVTVAPIYSDVLRWLFISRFAQAARLALLETGPWLSVWAGGVATVAWVVVCYYVVAHSFTPPDADEPDALLESRLAPPRPARS